MKLHYCESAASERTVCGKRAHDGLPLVFGGIENRGDELWRTLRTSLVYTRCCTCDGIFQAKEKP